jgi:hypothetical protein
MKTIGYPESIQDKRFYFISFIDGHIKQLVNIIIRFVISKVQPVLEVKMQK